MTSAVSRSIVTALCENQGCMDFKRLDHLIRQEFTVAESVLLRLLCDEEKFSIQEGQENSSGYAMSPDSVIVARTSLRLCQKPPAECSSSHCNHLHLCRYFVCGHCRFGNKCKNNHSLDSPDSGALLKKLDLQHLTNKQLFQLLLQNDPYLLPEICPHYNKGIGEHGSCRFGPSCSNLHLCLHNARGDCKFGPTCKRAHTVGEHILKILNGRGLGQENIQNLEKIYRNKFIILGHREQRKPFAPPAAVCPAPCPAPPPVSVPHTRHPSSSATSAPGATRTRHPSSSATSAPGATRTRHPSSSATSAPGATSPISETERNEICLYFIRRHCSFKEKCARVHYHLPYKWQVLDSDGSWKDLANMEDIEEAYCDAAKDTNCPDEPPLPSLFTRLLNLTPSPAASSDKRWVNFVTMTCGGSPVRRLSTASSVSKPPHYILTTQWMWYWKDETGIWMEYGAGGDRSASVTSLTLENVYLADADIEISFGAGKQKYILSCKDMQQQNVHYKTKREVRRRPRFVSSHEVEAKLKSVSSESASSSSSVAVPQHWDKTALPEISFTLIAVTNSMKEHKMIEQLFKRTMAFRTIYSIKRIQNPSLWRVFQWQKEQMQKKNGGKPVNESYLFHGTDESLLDAICEQNFDWRMCGVHGTAYGKGSYFARDASYSDRYTKAKPGSQRKFMFVVLVLVGDSTKASSCYVRPPAKGDGKGFYDSCVDSRSNPSIFVIFDKLQIYPEYIVEYV